MMPAEWRSFAAFLRAPRLPDKAAGISAAHLQAVGALFLLDLALMISLIGIAFAAIALGFEIPDNALGNMELTPMLVATIVLIVPLLEELAFRGWLSGRPAQLLPFAILIAAALLTGFVIRPDLAVQGGIIGAALLVAIAMAFKLRGRAPFGWFQRHFVWFYLLASLAFAAVHLTNYEDASPLFLLLVIPQGIAGLIFGYSRVTYGLWSNVMLHMMHNATFISFALLETATS